MPFAGPQTANIWLLQIAVLALQTMKPRSQTLFHFTKGINALESVLLKGFWPRYCLEDFSWYNPQVGYVSYPMVCFCDIPLTRIGDHVKFYGEYGIGVTKQWGIANKLAPILYLSQGTPLTSSLHNLVTNNQRDGNFYYEGVDEDLSTIIANIKPIEGNVLIGGLPSHKELYQENEWRFVPNTQGVKKWISKEEHNDIKTLDKLNEVAKQKATLQLSPNDIKYIFVKSDAEIPSIIDFIQTNLGNYSGNDLKVLMSRVLSLESINIDL